MNAVVNPLEHYRALVDAAAPLLPGGHLDWLVEQRSRGLKHFLAQGFPTRKQEAWRYTGLERVLEETWVPQAEPVVQLEVAELTRFWLSTQAAARLVFVNGRWMPALSTPMDAVPAGVQLGGLREALEEEPDQLSRWLGRVASIEQSAFSALNSALLDDGAWLQIAANSRLRAPIEILYLSVGQDRAAIHPRNLLVLEEGAQASVIEHYASLDDTPCLTNAVTEVLVGAGARLEHSRLLDESDNARHMSSVFVRQAGDSAYRGISASLGGVWSRSEYHAPLKSPGARCEIDGLYVAGDRRLADVHVEIEHAVASCDSRQRFKGLVLGSGRAVFDGLIRVQPQAQKTDAHLSNDNLLLSRDAEVDTKPQLEIYADDVKCSHGTTVGQLEPAQLFYLRSRGIGLGEARRLLCLGFATEVLDGCSVDGFVERVGQRLQQHLETTSIGRESEGQE